jgi:hypothetical protein
MDYSVHRVALRRAYLHAVSEINGPAAYDQSDDAFMDSLDRRLLELSKRKAPYSLPSARVASIGDNNSFRQLNSSTSSSTVSAAANADE